MSDEELFERLMDQIDRPYHRGGMNEPTHVFEAVNAVCGDQVRLEVRLTGGRVSEAWFAGRGCVVSQASASLLTQYIEGRDVSELRRFGESQMLELVGVRLTPHRQRCAILSCRALREILSQIPRGPEPGHLG